MAIALITDFGTSDHYVGAMKGAILTVDPAAVIVDITHEIPKHDIRAAAFTLGACWTDFPAGTVFVAVVDPGVGSHTRAIAAEAGGRFFVGLDNGIFSRVFAAAESFKAFEISDQAYFGPRQSNTFHGRDIFAPAAAHISKGLPVSKLGPAVSDPVIFEAGRPHRVSASKITAEVIHVDIFGNLITNVSPADLSGDFCLSINGREITALRQTYAGAAPGELFLIVGSTGMIEISANSASASEMTDCAVGQTFSIRF